MDEKQRKVGKLAKKLSEAAEWAASHTNLGLRKNEHVIEKVSATCSCMSFLHAKLSSMPKAPQRMP